MPDLTPSPVVKVGGRSRLVERGFRVLFQLAGRADAANLVSLSRISGLSRATTLRILRTMADLEVVTFDEATRVYRLGPAVHRLGAAASAHTDLVRIARPALERLQAETRETVCLFRRQGDDRVCIAAVTSEQELKYSIEVGQRRPLLRGAPGKAMATWMPADELDRLSRRLSPAERRSLMDDCRRIRAAGVAVSTDEVVRGGTAVAVPVLGPDGRLAAILAVLGPTARLDRETVRPMVARVKEAAEVITGGIGGAP